MRKFMIVLLMMIVLSSGVFAYDLNINSIKIYVNDVRQSGADSTGGDIEDVQPSDVVEFRIDLQNNANDTLSDILVHGQINGINNGRNLNLDLPTFNLLDGESDRKVVAFTIPTYAEDDTYNVYLKIRDVNTNDTEEYQNLSYTITVYSSHNTAFDIPSAITNLTSSCNQLFNQTQYIRGVVDVAVNQVNECKNNLSGKTGELNTAKQQLSDTVSAANKVQVQLTQCTADLAASQSNYFSLSSLHNSSVLQLNGDVETCKKNAQNTQTMMIVIAALLVGAYFFFKNKGNLNFWKKGGVDDFKASGINMINRGSGGGF